MDADVDLEVIGKSEQCDGYTGADLAALIREAGIQALKDFMIANDTQKSLCVNTEHFNKAVNKIRPSISEKVHCNYVVCNLFCMICFVGPKTLRKIEENVHESSRE